MVNKAKHLFFLIIFKKPFSLFCIFNYCCPLKLKMAKTSYPKPCKIGLRAYSFKK